MSRKAHSTTDTPLLSVIVTAHAEGRLIDRTLASVRRAIEAMGTKVVVEIILHADNPTEATNTYIKTHKKTTLNGVRIFTNSFGDLGSSRNFAINQTKGKYVATIDADDLMSRSWLSNAIDTLEKSTEPTIAHSELTIEFEGADGLIIKHGEIDKIHDTLLSVYANRWNSVIVAPRKLLVKFPYTPNSPGYGYEDWHLNCRLIEAGVHNVLVPQTVIFVRRKRENSEWLRQKQSMAVLRANPLLALGNVRKLPSNPFARDAVSLLPQEARVSVKSVIKRHPLIHEVARRVKRTLKRRTTVPTSFNISEWLRKEWDELHSIEKEISLTPQLAKKLPVYDSLTPEHKIAGGLYKNIADELRFDTYDYLIFVPWLIKGGADSYAINYANTIASLKPNKRVLVIATLPVSSVWKDRLNKPVDFLDFGNITQGVSLEIQYRLLSHLIENSGITHIHIINSELGYDFVRLYEKYIQASDKKVVLTSFSQSRDKSGRIFGYSHTHVPPVYHLANLITSDNHAVITMWQDKYGFDADKLVVHHQPVSNIKPLPKHHSNHQPLRVLWAARIAPEKLPELLGPIGRKAGNLVHVDMYGTIEPEYKKLVKNLPKNIKYKGGFNGFASLPLQNYDCLLYTSLFDGMPNTLLDAAANGLPLIASDVGGISEFVKHQETGLLVSEPEDADEYVSALLTLAGNPQVGMKLAKNAQIRLKDSFSPSSYKSQIDQMLKDLEY